MNIEEAIKKNLPYEDVDGTLSIPIIIHNDGYMPSVDDKKVTFYLPKNATYIQKRKKSFIPIGFEILATPGLKIETNREKKGFATGMRLFGVDEVNVYGREDHLTVESLRGGECAWESDFDEVSGLASVTHAVNKNIKFRRVDTFDRPQSDDLVQAKKRLYLLRRKTMPELAYIAMCEKYRIPTDCCDCLYVSVFHDIIRELTNDVILDVFMECFPEDVETKKWGRFYHRIFVMFLDKVGYKSSSDIPPAEKLDDISEDDMCEVLSIENM